MQHLLEHNARQLSAWVQTPEFASQHPQAHQLVDAFQQCLRPSQQPRAPDLKIAPIAYPLRGSLYHIAVARRHHAERLKVGVTDDALLCALSELCTRPESWLVLAHFTTAPLRPDWASGLIGTCGALSAATRSPAQATVAHIGQQRWKARWASALRTIEQGCDEALRHPTALFAEANDAATALIQPLTMACALEIRMVKPKLPA